METKTKNEERSILIEVPMGGYCAKLDISPLANIFDLYYRDDLLKSLRTLVNDSYATYARNLENSITTGSVEGICANFLENLYNLQVLIEHIEKCNFIENNKTA